MSARALIAVSAVHAHAQVRLYGPTCRFTSSELVPDRKQAWPWPAPATRSTERRSSDSPTANAARHFCQDMCVRNRTNFPAIPPTSQLSKQLIGLASFSAEREPEEPPS